MTEATNPLLNQSAKKLALLAERVRAAPPQCFLSEPIAVIGAACRFPGADNPEQFWQSLISGRDAVTEVPPDRWDVDATYDPDPQAPGKSYSRWGGFLDRIDEFDAAFFGVSPREAQQMDPRQRILLETAWEALENAALAPGRLSGSNTGVFIGHMVGDYYHLEMADIGAIDAHVGTGNLDAVLANRLSYVLNLQGPSLAVDTACSSSLVAVYLACQSLRQDECRTALAGGVNLMLTPEMHVLGAKSLLLSPDGRSKTFDRRANGFVRGEGCGLLVLKRLADALSENDNVLAVIRGIAVNQDGRTNGLSAPNGLSQQRVIRRALHNALLEPSRVTFVETHGTGTVVGDTVEFEALAEVYGPPSAEGDCHLGAVKTNIGHLEGAAGAASVIKTLLCLQHGRIPPNLHFREINPYLRMGPTRLRLPLEPLPWPAAMHPRCAAVSSFGLGGTNAHTILEEAPQPIAASPAVERPLHLLTLSAKDEQALRELALRYDAFVQAHPEVSLPDMAFTANTGRNHFACRAAVVADSLAALRTCLGQISAARATREGPRVAFLFPGRTASCDDPRRELYATQPAFRRAVDRCKPVADRPEFALFTLEYALAELWLSWGIRPTMCLGDGIGACVAEVVRGECSLEDGLRKSVGGGAEKGDSFAPHLRALHEQGCDVFLQIGPGRVINIGRQTVTDPGVLWLHSLDPARPAWQALLESLTALYERGAPVDWSGFDRDYPRRKMALPTYPFRRQRYWLPRHEAARDDSFAGLLYRLEWQPKPLVDTTAPPPTGDWLIVEHGGGLGDQLAAELGRLGGRALVARAFQPSPTGVYHGVVYLCGSSEEPDPPAEAEAATVGLLLLVQALVRAGSAARLWVVTRGSQAVTRGETVGVTQAPLWGLARTIRLEHPEFQVVCIDLAPGAADLDPLVAELLAPGEPQVTYRDGTRYVARLVRDGGLVAPPLAIRADGCYLITGGLGALGLQVARHLVEQGARHLVLAGRHRRESAVAALHAGGATVQVVEADVTRPGDVARLVETCQAQAPLRGVVHAAGVLDDGILTNLTAERCVQVLGPKVRGGWELHTRTQSLPLDFFVCFSSMASLLGSPGQGNYAAANAFLDALAQHRRARGLPGVSINWGPWAGAGMAAKLHSRLRAHGEGMLEPAVALRLFTHVLARGAAQVGVMPIAWDRYAVDYPAPEFLSLLRAIPGGPTFRQRLRDAPPDRRARLLEGCVRSAVGGVLGHPPAAVPRGEGFAELGLDSLGAIELRTQLERALECRLPATLAFDYPTVDALVAHLAERLAGPPAPADAPPDTRDLDDLTHDEIAALLAGELGAAEKGTNP
jgi:acyl transferase domain-containing protein/acyl carrier protein